MIGSNVTLKEDTDWTGVIIGTYSVEELNKMIQTKRYETLQLVRLLVGVEKVEQELYLVEWKNGYINPWFPDELIFHQDSSNPETVTPMSSLIRCAVRSV